MDFKELRRMFSDKLAMKDGTESCSIMTSHGGMTLRGPFKIQGDATPFYLGNFMLGDDVDLSKLAQCCNCGAQCSCECIDPSEFHMPRLSKDDPPREL